MCAGWLELGSDRCSRVRSPGGAVLYCWDGGAAKTASSEKADGSPATKVNHFYNGITGPNGSSGAGSGRKPAGQWAAGACGKPKGELTGLPPGDRTPEQCSPSREPGSRGQVPYPGHRVPQCGRDDPGWVAVQGAQRRRHVLASAANPLQGRLVRHLGGASGPDVSEQQDLLGLRCGQPRAQAATGVEMSRLRSGP